MRKRTYTRGVIGALAFKWASLLAFAYLGAEVTRYIAKSNAVPSPLASGPFQLYSLGWWVSQTVAVLIGFLAGSLCAHLAPPNTWRAPAILALAYLCLGVAAVPASAGWGLGVYWVLASPAALLLGAFAYMQMEGPRAA